ncbi:MAG: hypothetical protein Q9168_005302 [Polycauliona sp. 1 TL-2023]
MLAAPASQFVTFHQQSSSLESLSRLWRFGWLRGDTPSQNPSLTAMESQTDIDIVMFPEKEPLKATNGSIQAQTDKALRVNIISTGMLARLGVTHTASPQESVKARNVQYSPVGQVTLRWNKKETVRSFSGTFSVVTAQTPQVILGAPAFSHINQSTGGALQPIGVEPQTPAQKLAMEQKKLVVAQKREQERKDQEAAEAERRRQAAPKT